MYIKSNLTTLSKRIIKFANTTINFKLPNRRNTTTTVASTQNQTNKLYVITTAAFSTVRMHF